eukprot:7878092-Lingulodinium_polyedra.AAC.1
MPNTPALLRLFVPASACGICKFKQQTAATAGAPQELPRGWPKRTALKTGAFQAPPSPQLVDK